MFSQVWHHTMGLHAVNTLYRALAPASGPQHRQHSHLSLPVYPCSYPYPPQCTVGLKDGNTTVGTPLAVTQEDCLSPVVKLRTGHALGNDNNISAGALALHYMRLVTKIRTWQEQVNPLQIWSRSGLLCWKLARDAGTMCPPEHYNLIETNSPLFIGQFHGLIEDRWGEQERLTGCVLFFVCFYGAGNRSGAHKYWISLGIWFGKGEPEAILRWRDFQKDLFEGFLITTFSLMK